MFVEVKSAHDAVSENQKRLIHDNTTHLHLPFKIAKVHKTATEGQ